MTLTTLPDSRAVVLSYRVYRALLTTYPRRFRHAYQDEVAQLFRDCCREAQLRRGTRGLLHVWGRALLDLYVNVPREYIAQLTARRAPAVEHAQSCSCCYSEIEPDWRVCKICGTYLNDGALHDTRPIPSYKVRGAIPGLRGVNHPLSFRDHPDR